jgi:hypothetical protein
MNIDHRGAHILRQLANLACTPSREVWGEPKRDEAAMVWTRRRCERVHGP